MSGDKGWLVATVECRVCSHRHISVYPASILEEDNQECPNCHAMSCEPVEYHGPKSAA